uniref:Uncharacterized protein n=1 Tax=Candidatus Kentrum sp. LFY TaxID=2126342 RepID=A0A450UYZ0_9GAMM|nr:MAG: hypothetical protein BECKLFY1418A_GA0070994_107321 [Candidatus Kentron sp. LFY]
MPTKERVYYAVIKDAQGKVMKEIEKPLTSNVLVERDGDRVTIRRESLFIKESYILGKDHLLETKG